MVINPFKVFIIEDNEADIELMKFLFANCEIPVELFFVEDGGKASDFLNKRNEFEKSPTPDLILMDLNVPVKDGRELLVEFKAHPRIRPIPIVMVTTSSSDREILEFYNLGASAFISKPMDVSDFQIAIQRLVAFWFGCVALPSRVPQAG